MGDESKGGKSGAAKEEEQEEMVVDQVEDQEEEEDEEEEEMEDDAEDKEDTEEKEDAEEKAEENGDENKSDEEEEATANAENEKKNGDVAVNESKGDKEVSKKEKGVTSKAESSVGIKAFLGTHKGFHGIVKERYSDFQVNEITFGEEVVHLTDSSTPSLPAQAPTIEKTAPFPDILSLETWKEIAAFAESADKGKEGKKEDDKEKAKSKGEKKEDKESEEKKDDKESEEKKDDKESEEKKDDKESEEKADDKESEEKDKEPVKKGKKKSEQKKDEKESEEMKGKENKKTEDEANGDKGEKESKKETGGKGDEMLINVDSLSKEERTKVHKEIKGRYEGVSSNTKEVDGVKYIIIRRGKSAQKSKRDWPKSCAFTHFVLYKENQDTMDAINNIAWKLRVKANMIGYLGTKDRRGKTSQMVSVRKILPKRLVEAARGCRGIFVGNFKFSNKPLKLGQLYGNKFTIALRKVKGSDDDISAAVESLKDSGFINYYGMQRFGSSAAPTHNIGRALLQADWKEAINMILTAREGAYYIVQKACRVWHETGDADKALEELRGSSRNTIEGRLLVGMTECGAKDYVNVLNKIPRNIRTLYLHAYQSYLWNTVVSRRVEKYKFAVLPGDLVRVKKTEDESEATDETVEEEEKDEEPMEEEDEQEEEKKETEEVAKGEGENEEEEEGETLDEEEKESRKIRVRTITADEVDSTDITEVLIPLPGHNITFPDNEIKEWYEEMLKADGLDFNSLHHKVKSYSVSGAYRPMVVRPKDVTSKVCYYNNMALPLIQSDIEKLKNISIKDHLLEEGDHKAVILEMTLPSSSYATIALRELMKMDTSSEFQSTLNASNRGGWNNDRPYGARGRGGRGGRGWGDNRSRGWDDSRGRGWHGGRGGGGYRGGGRGWYGGRGGGGSSGGGGSGGGYRGGRDWHGGGGGGGGYRGGKRPWRGGRGGGGFKRPRYS